MKDYNDRSPSAERYKGLHPRKMQENHVCMCDNNILNLSNRREVTPDGRKSVSMFNSPIRNIPQDTLYRTKWGEITPKVGELLKTVNSVRSEMGTETPKTRNGDIKNRLFERFKDIYETQSPSMFRQKRLSRMILLLMNLMHARK